jgi:hypothetical protein
LSADCLSRNREIVYSSSPKLFKKSSPCQLLRWIPSKRQSIEKLVYRGESHTILVKALYIYAIDVTKGSRDPIGGPEMRSTISKSLIYETRAKSFMAFGVRPNLPGIRPDSQGLSDE